MDQNALVFDIQKYCVHDGPGIRTTIFFKGCTLNCKWCANPESQSFRPNLFLNKAKCIGCGNCAKVCKNGAFFGGEQQGVFDRSQCVECGACTEACHARARKMFGKEYTVQELINAVERDAIFYKLSGGGVTFSGGEPALWPDQIRELAKHFFEKGISTAIETCGHTPWENYEKFLPFIDLVLFDVKVWSPEKHKEYCGASNELIFENLKKIVKTNETVIRMPIIPGINDSQDELRQIARYVQSLEAVNKIHILPYHNMATGKYDGLGREYPLPDIIPPAESHMERVKSIFEEYGFEVKIGG